MTEPITGDRVIAKRWGEDGTVEGILQPATMDEPRTVRDDFGNDLYVEGPIRHAPAGNPKRINVAINPETLEILKRTIDRDGVSLTEAVRRLIGVGDAVMTPAKTEGAEVLLKTSAATREVVIL